MVAQPTNPQEGNPMASTQPKTYQADIPKPAPKPKPKNTKTGGK